MERIQDFEILEKLNETKDAYLYKGHREGQTKSVVIKVLKKRFPAASDVVRFRQEYEKVINVDIEGVIKILEIINYENSVVLIQDYVECQYLISFLEQNNSFDIELFLQIAIKICIILGEIHKKNIIHRNINPYNILFNPNNIIVLLTGFAISLDLINENDIFDSESVLGSLAYISPEQTGRMNRTIDSRTDLYSLGATFYRMLTGVVPFESTDPIEIIHSHIAREPVPPIERKADIPKVVSDIVLKLLSKDADNRYQSAFGVMADFKTCLDNLDGKGNIQPFDLAKSDISGRFIMPQRLIGRDQEVGILMSAYNRVSGLAEEEGAGNIELMLVAGSPGVGKTALVNETGNLIIEKKGYFLSGKYEQFRGETPYSAIIHVFQKLLRLILTSNDEYIMFIKESMLEALGPNAKLITDIIPELELIIGSQPDVIKLAPNEERNRFNLVFERFIGVFPGMEHPLAIFLDNLQWADQASLQLLRNILINSTIKHLLIIGSYRDNEVNAEHPLMKIMKEIEMSGTRSSKITLTELTEQNVRELLINFLKYSEERVFQLAELTYKKTGGNPFFVNEFLHTLYTENIIKIEAGTGWNWDIEQVRQVSITDNVVELLSHKITRLPHITQDLLKKCACIGNRFDIEMLAALMEKSIDDIVSILSGAIDEGFINTNGYIYIFNHERIQEIAYSLLDESEKSSLHYRIGKIALQKTDAKDLQDRLFYIVDQLNLGSGLITDEKEKEELARLNLNSGKKAKASTAYLPALRYFHCAMELLNDKCWDTQYKLALSLYSEAAETVYLKGDYDKIEQYASTVVRYAKNVYDTIPIYETQIIANDTQSNFRKSIEISFEVLKKLNYPLLERVSKLRLKLALLKTRLYLSVIKIDSLLDLPQMTDPHMLAVAHVLSYPGASSFNLSQDLFVYITLKRFNLSRKYGLSKSQAIAFMGMANVLTSFVGDIKTGYALGTIALKLVKKLDAKSYEAWIYSMFNIFTSHWKEPLKSIRNIMMEAYHLAMQTGTLTWAASSLFQYDGAGMNIGTELTELEKEISRNHKIMEQLKQSVFLGPHAIFWQMALNLLGRSEFASEFKGPVLDEEQFMNQWKATNIKSVLGSFHVHRLLLRYIFNNYQGAIADAEVLPEYLDGLAGGIGIRDYHFYSSLARLAVYPDIPDRRKKEYKRLVNHSFKKFKKWVKHGPENNEQRLEIIKAEKARVFGRHKQAEISYDKAIELSRKNEYLVEEAIANELAGMYYISRGQQKLARIYLQDAYSCYAKWGAAAKLEQMQQKYAEAVSPISRPLITDSDTTAGSTPGSASQIIDISTVVKASQILSGEVVLGKLLARMIKIAMENAGAQKAFMILEDNEKFFIEAEGRIENEDVSVLNSIPLETYEGLSSSIVHYVIRTNEMLILDNALEEGDFTRDPYVIKNNSKSILCIPIMNQAKLTAILYLENDLSAGAFTEERREILKLLSSQIAISIENARFYEKLEKKVNERTSDLSKANQQLELEIQGREKIEEQLKVSNKELESFAYIVSHDLQEPLRKIMIFADKLMKKNNDGQEQRDDDYFERMQSAAKRMQGLINGLLNYSRVTTKSKSFEDVDLNKIAEEVLTDLEVRIRETGGKAETSELPVIKADPLQMRQLFQNLIGNGLKFHKKDEAPAVNIYRMDDSPEGNICIIVEDNGIGIEEKDYERIFGVFQRLHGRSEYEGTGIGLSVCKKIAERHGGRIEVVSKIGEGTKFIIHLAKME